jgi:hypothetical protein
LPAARSDGSTGTPCTCASRAWSLDGGRIHDAVPREPRRSQVGEDRLGSGDGDELVDPADARDQRRIPLFEERAKAYWKTLAEFADPIETRGQRRGQLCGEIGLEIGEGEDEVGAERFDLVEAGIDERRDSRLRAGFRWTGHVARHHHDALALAEEVERLDGLLGEADDPLEVGAHRSAVRSAKTKPSRSTI